MSITSDLMCCAVCGLQNVPRGGTCPMCGSQKTEEIVTHQQPARAKSPAIASPKTMDSATIENEIRRAIYAESLTPEQQSALVIKILGMPPGALPGKYIFAFSMLLRLSVLRAGERKDAEIVRLKEEIARLKHETTPSINSHQPAQPLAVQVTVTPVVA